MDCGAHCEHVTCDLSTLQ